MPDFFSYALKTGTSKMQYPPNKILKTLFWGRECVVEIWALLGTAWSSRCFISEHYSLKDTETPDRPLGQIWMNYGKYKGAKEKRLKETELLMTSIRVHLGKRMKNTSNIWMTCSQTHQMGNIYKQQKSSGFFTCKYISVIWKKYLICSACLLCNCNEPPKWSVLVLRIDLAGICLFLCPKY